MACPKAPMEHTKVVHFEHGPDLASSENHLPVTSNNSAFDVSKLFQQWTYAIDLYFEGDLKLSAKKHRQILRDLRLLVPPQHPETPLTPEIQKFIAVLWFNLGQIQTIRGQEAVACEAFSLSVKTDKKSALSWFSLGNSYFKLGSFEKSVTAFGKCLEIFDEMNTTSIDVDLEVSFENAARINSEMRGGNAFLDTSENNAAGTTIPEKHTHAGRLKKFMLNRVPSHLNMQLGDLHKAWKATKVLVSPGGEDKLSAVPTNVVHSPVQVKTIMNSSPYDAFFNAPVEDYTEEEELDMPCRGYHDALTEIASSSKQNVVTLPAKEQDTPPSVKEKAAEPATKSKKKKKSSSKGKGKGKMLDPKGEEKMIDPKVEYEKIDTKDKLEVIDEKVEKKKMEVKGTDNVLTVKAHGKKNDLKGKGKLVDMKIDAKGKGKIIDPKGEEKMIGPKVEDQKIDTKDKLEVIDEEAEGEKIEVKGTDNVLTVKADGKKNDLKGKGKLVDMKIDVKDKGKIINGKLEDKKLDTGETGHILSAKPIRKKVNRKGKRKTVDAKTDVKEKGNLMDTKVEDTKVEDTKVEDTKVEDTKVEDTKDDVKGKGKMVDTNWKDQEVDVREEKKFKPYFSKRPTQKPRQSAEVELFNFGTALGKQETPPLWLTKHRAIEEHFDDYHSLLPARDIVLDDFYRHAKNAVINDIYLGTPKFDKDVPPLEQSLKGVDDYYRKAFKETPDLDGEDEWYCSISDMFFGKPQNLSKIEEIEKIAVDNSHIPGNITTEEYQMEMRSFLGIDPPSFSDKPVPGLPIATQLAIHNKDRKELTKTIHAIIKAKEDAKEPPIDYKVNIKVDESQVIYLAQEVNEAPATASTNALTQSTAQSTNFGSTFTGTGTVLLTPETPATGSVGGGPAISLTRAGNTASPRYSEPEFEIGLPGMRTSLPHQVAKKEDEKKQEIAYMPDGVTPLQKGTGDGVVTPGMGPGPMLYPTVFEGF
ncbi:hypothetical protein MMC15_001000 [Xylographa vitiligo]|nr:hypothetical protein [Xylographa vitiligo]